jgi:hypothetical protein
VTSTTRSSTATGAVLNEAPRDRATDLAALVTARHEAARDVIDRRLDVAKLQRPTHLHHQDTRHTPPQRRTRPAVGQGRHRHRALPPRPRHHRPPHHPRHPTAGQRHSRPPRLATSDLGHRRRPRTTPPNSYARCAPVTPAPSPQPRDRPVTLTAAPYGPVRNRHQRLFQNSIDDCSKTGIPS